MARQHRVWIQYMLQDAEDCMDVVIVDDSPLMLERITNIVRSIEYVKIVGTADSTSSAVELIFRTRPQLVLLDLLLKSGNGLEVLRAIRSENIDAKVAILTNYSEKQYRRISLEEGADYLLDKSQEFDKIEQIVQSLASSIDEPT